MKKRFLSLLLAFSFVVTGAIPAFAETHPGNPFTDVPDNVWYTKAVDYVSSKKFFAGTSETTFSPDLAMTRAMFVQVLANQTTGYRSEDYTEFPFDDVSEGAWYAPAVQWALENGVAAGMGFNNFGPENYIDREQMITMLYNYSKLVGMDLTNSYSSLWVMNDRAFVSSWAETPMEWALANYLIAGTAHATLSPHAEATRAQVATVLYNGRDFFPEEKVITIKRMSYQGTDNNIGWSLEIQQEGIYLDYTVRKREGNLNLSNPNSYTEWSGICTADTGTAFSEKKRIVTDGKVKTIYLTGEARLSLTNDNKSAFWSSLTDDISVNFELRNSP